MHNIELDNLFEPSNKSVLDFFSISGGGYLIPEYQRPYSWDKDNINQLTLDISEGVERLLIGTEQELHFLGTVITVRGKESKYADQKGKPTRVDMIIDGQQRVITITIIASALIKSLVKILNGIKSTSNIYGDVKEVVDAWNEKLMTIISFDLLRGKPRLKPRVIRGGNDFWTFDSARDTAYKSEISNYQAQFIEQYLEFKSGKTYSFPLFKEDGNYLQNAKRIERWLSKVVSDAHKNNDGDYPVAFDIIHKFPQSLLWEYDRDSLIEQVDKQHNGIGDKESELVCTLVQILSVCYYLLHRCCFCVIKTEKEDWAFDMFQSLNATGTPLTAIETFKPVIVNGLKNEHIDYKGSNIEKYFTNVESFLKEPTSAVQKTKRTNDYIVSFFVAYNGEKVPTHFSGERRALVNSYSQLSTSTEREVFIKKMSDYAKFYNLWLKYDGTTAFKMNDINDDSELISLLISFLKGVNHRMAISTLSSIYSQVIDKDPEGDKNFIEVVKATTAFYFLWRTCYPNNGLDVAYRNLFADCFKNKKQLTPKLIKEYFLETLQNKGLHKPNWKQNASAFLKYNNQNKDYIRFALLMSYCDTIADPNKKGLLKKGKPGTCDYLKLKYWKSNELSTIEHIAPQTNPGMWDSQLYDQDTMYVNTIGNLTLLPTNINSSVGNKSLQEKLMYYKSVAEDDPFVLEEIDQKAKKLGITLNASTIDLLKNCKYGHHISSISSLDYCDTWKVELVKARTNAILDIIWDNLISWLS